MVKKKHFILSILLLVMISCQKENLFKNVNDSSGKISNYEESQVRKFKKEIVVYDETNKNNIMIALHADDENIISDFLNNNELKINLFDLDSYEVIETPMSSTELVHDNFRGDMDSEPKLIIELVKQNIDSNGEYFSLSFERKNLNKNYVLGYPIGFETSTQTIGSVHLGFGYSYLTQYQFKKENLWNLSWHYIYKNEVNAWFVNPYPEYYNYFNFSNIATRKRGMIIRPDQRQGQINYKVFTSTFSSDAFSRECPLGTYDFDVFGECYYGTVPTGTNAFTYNYGGSTGVWFMYTPLNGSCPWTPEPESGFDGANCKVVQIPPNRVGTEYIWNRNLLIEAYRIGEI